MKGIKTQILSVVVFLVFIFGFMTVFSGKASAKWKEPVFPIIEGMQQIGDGVFVSTGEYLKDTIGLIVSGNEAVVIDTGLKYESDEWTYTPYEAFRVKEYIESHGLKLKYVLLTHEHIDHVGNLEMFSGVEVFKPGNTKDGQIITFGDKTFKVVKTIGHLNDEHISFEIVEQNILFAGDVVVTNMPSAVAFGGNFKGLVQTLEMLRTKNFSTIVPGHGDILNSHEAIKMQLEYLKNVEKYVVKAIEGGAVLEDVLKIKLEDCVRNTETFDPVDTQTVHEWNLETAYYEFISGK